MYGSAVVNQQQHVGLQELSALGGAVASLLGPRKAFKLVQEEGGGPGALVSSCHRLLQCLEPAGAVGQLAVEAVQAHVRAHGSGSASLLYLAGAWSRAALEGLRMGVPVPHVAAALAGGLDACLEACQRSATPLREIGPGARPSGAGHKARHGDCRQGSVGLACSKHFCQARPLDVARVARALCHGCPVAMALAVDAWRLQCSDADAGSAAFDVGTVTTCLLPGVPEERCRVEPGCVVPVATERAALARHLEGRPLNAVLVDGDLRQGYRHLGFSRPSGVMGVAHRLGEGEGEEAWQRGIVATLATLQVDVVLVRGAACQMLACRCACRGLLVLERLPVCALKALANATGAVPVTYTAQLTPRCLGAGMQLRVRTDLGSDLAVSLSPGPAHGPAPGLVTVVLASHVPAQLQALEDRFWGCAHRLRHALRDGAVLPGGGAIEAVCVHRLRRLAAGGASVPPYRGLVLGLMADGLLDHICTLVANGGTHTRLEAQTAMSQRLELGDGRGGSGGDQLAALLGEEREEEGGGGGGPVCDNLSVKMEVWRRALDLVLLVLQTDAEVITGLDLHASLTLL